MYMDQQVHRMDADNALGFRVGRRRLRRAALTEKKRRAYIPPHSKSVVREYRTVRIYGTPGDIIFQGTWVKVGLRVYKVMEQVEIEEHGVGYAWCRREIA